MKRFLIAVCNSAGRLLISPKSTFAEHLIGSRGSTLGNNSGPDDGGDGGFAESSSVHEYNTILKHATSIAFIHNDFLFIRLLI
ncbi:MAG: hypothetical protein IKQ32_00850 [Prevotella sp.]|nr:hypothetical protein [Prevotella sp.]